MIIDAHAHIYPEKIAVKASNNVGNFYGITMAYDGSLEHLLEEGKRAGVTKFLVHSVATKPAQVASINRFIAESVAKYPDQLIGFCAMHPDSDHMEEEFRWAMAHGLKGIKLHPDFQNFYLDEEKAKEIYRLAEGVCPILFHMGDSRTQFSKAERLVNVMREFPNLDCIAAHFGGYSEWATGAAFLATERCYVDTSSSTFRLEPYKIRQLVDIYGADRILFGTDYPMWDATEELSRLLKAGFTEEEKEKMFHLNLEKLLAKYEQ